MTSIADVRARQIKDWDGFKPGNSLTHKELECLRLIRTNAIAGRRCTHRPLMADLDYKSPRSATLHLESLVEKGFVSRLELPTTARSDH